MKHPDLIVGIDTADDAGVYKLNEDIALIQTVDFFTPIVDDPYTFGQIAAANSLSDVYAMGGKPLTAMNIVAFPACTLDGKVLLKILEGGQNKIDEAGAVLVGGHTVNDKEPKYGLSVTGTVHPTKVLANRGAKVGDKIILTKGLGTGILSLAAKAEMFSTGVKRSVESMCMLNKYALDIALKYQINACTDITGFGLLGHLYEMAKASKVDIEINSSQLPLLPEAKEAASIGFVPKGAYDNREYLKDKVVFEEVVEESLKDILCDPQTSGGLLFSVSFEHANALLEELQKHLGDYAACIGTVTCGGKGKINVN